ncbi:hypothetical protein ABPG75_004472 [Micractinium tetrahymenae]
MLKELDYLLLGETLPIAEAFEAEGGFGMLAWLERPQASDIRLPAVVASVAETLDDLRTVRAGASCKSADEVPGGLKVCANCRITRYCSAECQLKDWRSGHKQRCPKIAEGWQRHLAEQAQRGNSRSSEPQ